MNDDIIESVVQVFDMFDDIYGENDLITYRAFEHLDQLTIIEDY